MGFLSGILGGGSKTTVKQTSTNTTNVDIGIGVENLIDLSSLSDALKDVLGKFSDGVSKIGSDTNEVLKSLSDGQKIEALALLADVQQKVKQNEMIAGLLNNAGKYGRYLLLAGGAYFVWRQIK